MKDKPIDMEETAVGETEFIYGGSQYEWRGASQGFEILRFFVQQRKWRHQQHNELNSSAV